MLKIVIADDHPLFRDAIALALGELADPDAPQILEAESADEAKQLALDDADLDLLLLDLRMPGMDGLNGLIELRKTFPALPIVVISASDDPSIVRNCLAFGAMGFVPKSYERKAIAAAIRSVLAGNVYRPATIVDMETAADVETTHAASMACSIETLTSQQLRVLQAISRGQPNKIIAYELGITEKTVKAHVTAILKKLGVTNRTQAVLAARRVIDPDAQSRS